MSVIPNKALLEALPDAVFIIARDGAMLYANPSCESAFEWNREYSLGMSILDLVHPDDVAGILKVLATSAEPKDYAAVRVRVASASAEWHDCELIGPVEGVGADSRNLILMARPDSLVAHVADLTAAESTVVLHHTPAIMAVMTPDGRARALNGALGHYLGYINGKDLEIPFSRLVADRDRPRVLREIAALAPGETVMLDTAVVRLDGVELSLQIAVSNLLDEPSVGGYLLAAQPPTAQDRRGLVGADGIDASSGLLNRAGLLSESKSRLGPLSVEGQCVHLLLFELDRTNQINELLGENVGARVVALVASRLKLAVRTDDILARIGNDEFALATVANPDTVLMLKERLLSVVAQPMNIDGHELRVTASAALASGSAPLSVESLITDASGRLRVSRGSSPSHAVTTASALAERRTLVEQLRLAVDRDELQPWFQPIVDRFATVVGYEALIRWEHPYRGVLGPGAFLPLVTMAGLDQQVEDIVMTRSLEFVTRLTDRGNDFMRVHINISPRQLSNEDFGRRFLATVDRANASLTGLCVEITETDLLHVGTSAINNLSMLRRAGVHVAIDDFGTGFSSLSHLLELPANCLKIDRRFVEGVGIDPMATGLTKAILSLTNSMGIACVAEGVELQSQHDLLTEFGCQQFQGWLYAPALVADEALSFVCSEMLDYQ